MSSNPEARLPKDSLLVRIVRGHDLYEKPDAGRGDRDSGAFTSSEPAIKTPPLQRRGNHQEVTQR
jgi:hypothetical protein